MDRRQVADGDGGVADRRVGELGATSAHAGGQRRARAFVAEGNFVQRAETDETGTLRIDPAPPEPFRICTWPPGFDEFHADPEDREKQRIVLGIVQLPAGEKEAAFELKMPAGKR